MPVTVFLVLSSTASQLLPLQVTHGRQQPLGEVGGCADPPAVRPARPMRHPSSELHRGQRQAAPVADRAAAGRQIGGRQPSEPVRPRCRTARAAPGIPRPTEQQGEQLVVAQSGGARAARAASSPLSRGSKAAGERRGDAIVAAGRTRGRGYGQAPYPPITGALRPQVGSVRIPWRARSAMRDRDRVEAGVHGHRGRQAARRAIDEGERHAQREDRHQGEEAGVDRGEERQPSQRPPPIGPRSRSQAL